MPIALGGTGAGQGTGSLPLQLPGGAGPADVYIQTAVLEGSSIVLTNPLQVHLQ